MKPKHRYVVDVLFSGLIALSASWIFVIRNQTSYDYLTTVAYSLDPKPFVFRALLPMLARALEWLTGLPAVYGLVLLAILSSIGLYAAIQYLCGALKDQGSTQLLSFLVTEICLAVIALKYPKTYDVTTALLFTLAFGFLIRGRYLAYFLLFPVITLNRETSFLLVVFFAVWALPPSRQWAYGTAYQVLVYCLVRLAVNAAFADHPGAFLTWRPIENLAGYALHPGKSILAAIGIAILLYGIFRGWSSKPAFLRLVFVIVFSVQVFLYVTAGFPLEFRVFAESLPVVGLLALWDMPTVEKMSLSVLSCQQSQK